MTREEYEHIKEFAKEMAERFTAEEIAMILWEFECKFCAIAERKTCGGDCNCAAYIAIRARNKFKDYYNFYDHKEESEVEE